MAGKKRILVLGAAIVLALTGCTNGPSEPPPAESSDRLIPLSEIDPISVADDPLAEHDDSLTGGSPKFLAEVKSGTQRILMYANKTSCGFLTIPHADRPAIGIHLISQWPSEREGNSPYPAGPYNSSSGSDSSRTWASLACSRNAMVIEYTGSLDTDAESRGNVSVTRAADPRAASLIVVGSQEVREMITARVSTESS
ncbi:hypothetical protein ACIQ7Q_34845 [Streptomyces sp. NPDC096176]|uniref:hypothetical protein n=1 Tax=Streptomyces sp. NPDC096176 TaxID=3366079 RepID=UPI0038257541